MLVHGLKELLLRLEQLVNTVLVCRNLPFSTTGVVLELLICLIAILGSIRSPMIISLDVTTTIQALVSLRKMHLTTAGIFLKSLWPLSALLRALVSRHHLLSLHKVHQWRAHLLKAPLLRRLKLLLLLNQRVSHQAQYLPALQPSALRL